MNDNRKYSNIPDALKKVMEREKITNIKRNSDKSWNVTYKNGVNFLNRVTKGTYVNDPEEGIMDKDEEREILSFFQSNQIKEIDWEEMEDLENGGIKPPFSLAWAIGLGIGLIITPLLVLLITKRIFREKKK